jgi:cytochrome P460
LASGYSLGLGSTGKSRRWRTASANVGVWIELIPRYRQYHRPIVSLPRFCFDAFEGETIMKRIAFLLVTVAAVAGVVASSAPVSGHADGEAAPIFGVTIPSGYRDWRLISVAHEEGKLNDLRAILGNDVAIEAAREGKVPFPDGTIIARLAWSYVPSEENNKVFGRAQSFVAGPAPDWYLQVMVKDSRKYAATGGWGFAQFNKDGKAADEAAHKTCLPCHESAKARDFVFTHYAP